MKKRMLSILIYLALCSTLLPMTAGAAADKESYQTDPLFVDLDLDSSSPDDDENFVVMRKGAVILGPTEDMSIDVSADGSEYILQNPSQEAQGIREGTPVAWVDGAEKKAYFFVPTQITAQTDQVTFACEPMNTSLEDLFEEFSLSYEHSLPFSQNIDFTNAEGTLKLTGDLSGKSNFAFSLASDGAEVDWEVEYALTNAVLESGSYGDWQASLLTIPIGGTTGMETELEVELELSAADATSFSFDLTGGKAAVRAEGPLSQNTLSAEMVQAPVLQANQFRSTGNFEANITLQPRGKLFNMMEVGSEISNQVSVAARLTGDEGWNQAGQPWHTCKHASCVDGTVELTPKATAYIHTARQQHEQEQTFAPSSWSFYYTFSFDEFGWNTSCPHLLYPVEVTVRDAADNPIEGADVRYSPRQNFTVGTIDYCITATDEQGQATLYLPSGEAQTITASTQMQVGAPWNCETTVQSAVSCSVDSGDLPARAVIRMPSPDDLYQVTFDANAGERPAVNMPGAIFLKQGEGNLPNQAPRREGCFFMGWSTTPDGPGITYLPGGPVQGSAGDTLRLYAKWAWNPEDTFRTISYLAEDEGVIFADNPQFYYKDSKIPLLNPLREGYRFAGWTCEEVVGMSEPSTEVVVFCDDNGYYYINRVYVAHWEPVKYSVIWKDWDGSYLKVDPVAYYDELPDYNGPPPTREPDDQYYYIFAGWTPEIKVVTEDAQYTAVYNVYNRLKFTSSPQDVTLKAGETAVFRAETAGGGGEIAYQWYQIPQGVGADGAQPISGATTDTLTLTAADSMNGNRYYCVATDVVGQRVVSGEAGLAIRSSTSTSDDSDSSYSISLAGQMEGGQIILSRRYAEKGERVTLTVIPDQGYELDTLTVTDSTGKKVELTPIGDGQYTFQMPDWRVEIQATFRETVEEPLPFTDTDENAWYADAVRYVYQKGLMSGTSATTFAPESTTSRAMIAAILWRAAGSPVVDYAMDFADVEQGQWYSEAVRWAASEGIVSGYGDGTFGTDDPITREQFVTMLWRFARQQGQDVSIGEDTNILSYTDAGDLSEYAIPAMQWACGAGIISGTGDGSTLSPGGKATRAQAAMMLMRFLQAGA
ncbi:MAG: S-layer homology domain-containing protein [Eubacteriales bacterium]|jgi:hypothetical protein